MKKTCVHNEMYTQFQPMRFNVGSDAILLLAQSDITSLVLLPLLRRINKRFQLLRFLCVKASYVANTARCKIIFFFCHIPFCADMIV